jgi:hypothetical protein
MRVQAMFDRTHEEFMVLNASAFIDPVVCRANVVEDRTWRHGIEIVSHLNYDQQARVRMALGLMPDACGTTLSEESLVMPAHRRAPTVAELSNGLTSSEARDGLVLWSDIMEQIARVEEVSSAAARAVTTELPFGPVLYQEEPEPLLRSA